jgi:hypothetical protein
MTVSPRNKTSSYPFPSSPFPWVCLLAAIGWCVVLRIPLIVNAAIHLDSDLAVDGLTLQDAVEGRWRWHYPGTPFIGIGPVFLSWVQARLWGVSPVTLVSGGTVAHILALAATFALAWRVFGRMVAVFSLAPLTFASTGTIWLSGRITGGHLLIVAWSAVAWLLLHEIVARPRLAACGWLGLWCGLGVYLDSMFLMTLAGILAALASGAIVARARWRNWAPQSLVLCAAFLFGAAPRTVGSRMEPYDAYQGQLTTTSDPRLLAEHARILLLDCLPRLIAGHRLPGLQADPDPALLGTDAPIKQNNSSRDAPSWESASLTLISLTLAVLAIWTLGRHAASGPNLDRRLIAAGVLATVPALILGFLFNRNIFNSDNYRYLALSLIPWSLGFGLTLERAVRRPGKTRWTGMICVLAFAALFTFDATAWYRRLGWIDERCRPVRKQLDDPALRWLQRHPGVRALFGGYWDVYRLSFLTGGVVKGIPFSFFPDRFPELAAALPARRPETAIVRRSPLGQRVLNEALREGGKVLYREADLTILHWPWPKAREPR